MTDLPTPKDSELGRVPERAALEQLLGAGLTQKQIAERYQVSRSAIAMAISRLGLRSARPRERYMDTLPWTLSPRHRYDRDAKNLRLEGRRRRGLSLSDEEIQRLTAWRAELDRLNAVIVYDARTESGFYWLPRNESDDDIIRRPQ